MQYLFCFFDHRRNPPRPLYAVSHDPETSDFKFYTLYYQGTKIPLYEIRKTEQEIRDLILNNDVVLSNFKSYLAAFNLPLDYHYDVYDVGSNKINAPGNLAETKRESVRQLSKLIEFGGAEWQRVLARAQPAYRSLEQRGYYHNYKKRYPLYDLAYTGRSKCSGSNIQGASATDSIQHADEDFNTYVQFDWISADFRAASIISNDKILKESFKTSDPYTMLCEAINDESVSREQCKLELFKGLYSMNPSAPPMEFYSDFAKWMSNSIVEIESNSSSRSILDREFQLDDDRTIRSVFNAQIQGSVAHAMQLVIARVFQLYPNNILTEVHDALILCCPQDEVKNIIADVSQIMLYPFEDVLEDNPKFPLKVSIGFEWKDWHLYKEYR
jgi:hypothetical protein